MIPDKGRKDMFSSDGCFVADCDGVYTFSVDMGRVDFAAMGVPEKEKFQTSSYLFLSSKNNDGRSGIIENHVSFVEKLNHFTDVVEMFSGEDIMLTAVCPERFKKDGKYAPTFSQLGRFRIFFNELPE